MVQREYRPDLSNKRRRDRSSLFNRRDLRAPHAEPSLLVSVELLVRLSHREARRVLLLPRQQLLHERVRRPYRVLSQPPPAVVRVRHEPRKRRAEIGGGGVASLRIRDGERLERLPGSLGSREDVHEYFRDVLAVDPTDGHVALGEDRSLVRGPVIVQTARAEDAVIHP